MALDPITEAEDVAASVFKLLATKEGQVLLATLLGDYGIEQDELDRLVEALPDVTPPDKDGGLT